MSDATVRERFLKAEEEATQIIEALNQLRAEMGRYRDVRESLEGAVEATQEGAKGLIPISVRMKELLVSLDELGMPEVRSDLTVLRGWTETFEKSQAELRAAQSTLLERTLFLERVKALEERMAKLTESQLQAQTQLGAQLARITMMQYGILALVAVAAVLSFLALLP